MHKEKVLPSYDRLLEKDRTKMVKKNDKELIEHVPQNQTDSDSTKQTSKCTIASYEIIIHSIKTLTAISLIITSTSTTVIKQ